MIIKKYIVNDMKEALIRAKYELGKDAVIIHQRKIKEGKWYNPFKTTKLEVTLAIEEDKDNIKDTKEAKDPKETIQNKDIYGKNNMKNTNISKEKDIKTNILFKDANEELKEKLLSYCKLKSLDVNSLTSEDIKDFLNIGYKDNCFKEKLSLGKLNVMVGPTGVGKTTTIAKIAAKEYLENNKKVGLITLDTYKIGAVEQMRTYAEILDIDYEVVTEPNEMINKINKLSHCDILLIDTLGTSQRNKEKLQDIWEYLKDIKEDINTYLVLSISTDRETTLSIMDKYKQLEYDALILTKFDEVSSFTNVWNIMEHTDLPVEYFCHGQSVPDDIEIANIDNLIEYSKEVYSYD